MVSLHLNPDKTKAIYFGTGYFVAQINELNLPGVEMGEGVIAPFVQEIKSLGVILDSKLSWELHVISVEKKINRVLYTLRFSRHYCSIVLLDAGDVLRKRIQRFSNIDL